MRVRMMMRMMLMMKMTRMMKRMLLLLLPLMMMMTMMTSTTMRRTRRRQRNYCKRCQPPSLRIKPHSPMATSPCLIFPITWLGIGPAAGWGQAGTMAMLPRSDPNSVPRRRLLCGGGLQLQFRSTV